MNYMLNNQLLTSTEIIAAFDENLTTKRNKAGNELPWLGNFKKILKTMFFENLADKATDQQVLVELETDLRFTSGYPKLKQVLLTILALENEGDKAKALVALRAISASDWSADAALAAFNSFNTAYGYFDDPPAPVLLTLYTKLAISCRTMIVLFEKNNTRDDTMAYDYAYKLMALYVDPDNPPTFKAISTETDKLVKNIDNDKGHPFHQALLVELAQLPPAGELTDRAGWRKFVKENGIKAFSFLSMAKKIEEKNATRACAPKTLEEAKAIAMLCRYARATDDPDFAQLCYANDVKEKRFNACLDYMGTVWPKKTADFMPDMVTKGTGVAEGLYWVKLPVKDKRALILGDITNCCQSIKGKAELCVKDAVSLPYNAIYVLVKQRKKGGSPHLIVDDAINDHDFKIIGQFYAWESVSGNVCLDSLECLEGEVTDVVMGDSITQFANALLDKNPDVHYVTVGRAGKTPEGLFEKTIIPEKMRQGFFYGDAKEQYCIAKRVPKLKEVSDLLKGCPEPFHACMMYLCEHFPTTPELATEIGALLDKNPDLTTQLTPDTLMTLMTFSQPLALRDMEPVDFGALQALMPEKAAEYPPISLARLIWKMQPVPSLPGIRLQLDGVTDMITSAADFGAVLQYLAPEQCTSVCEFMQAKLPDIIKSVNDFSAVLQGLGNEERISVGEAMKDLLRKIITSADDFGTVLEYLAPAQCISMCAFMQAKLPDIIKSGRDFSAVLNHLGNEERLSVCEAMKDLLRKIITSAADFGHVMYFLTPVQRTSVCELMKDILPAIIQSMADFHYVLDFLSQEQRRSVFDLIAPKLSVIIETPDDFYHVLKEPLTHEQHTSVCDSIMPKLCVMIRSVPDFHRVLRHFTPAQRRTACEAMMTSPPKFIKSLPEFVAALKPLTPEQQIIVRESMMGSLPLIITSVAEFARVLELLTSAQRSILCESMLAKLPFLISSADEFVEALKPLTPAQCSILFDSMVGRLPLMLQKVHDLYRVFEFIKVLKPLTPAQCSILCESMVNSLRWLITTPNEFYHLLLSLSKEQHASVFKSIQHLPQTFTGSVEDFRVIMDRLTEDERTIVYNSIQDYTPRIIHSRTDLSTVLKTLPVDTWTSVIKSMPDLLHKIINSPVEFADLLNQFNTRDCISVCESMPDLPHKIIKSPADLGALLQTLSPRMCANVFDFMMRLQPAFITSWDDFSAVLLVDLPDNKRQIFHDSMGPHWLKIVDGVDPSFGAFKRFVNIDTVCSATLLKLEEHKYNQSYTTENKEIIRGAIKQIKTARGELRQQHFLFMQHKGNIDMEAVQDACCIKFATTLTEHILPLRQEQILAQVEYQMFNDLVKALSPLVQDYASISEITKQLCVVDPVESATMNRFKAVLNDIRASGGCQKLGKDDVTTMPPL